VGVAGHVTALDQSNFRIQNAPNYTTDNVLGFNFSFKPPLKPQLPLKYGFKPKLKPKLGFKPKLVCTIRF